jgi:hypothetical protein
MPHSATSRSLFACLILILSLALSSCWIPENFDARVAINKDGSYTFTYDGTLTFGLALAAAKEGSLSAQDEAELQGEAAKIRQEPGFKKVDYQGKGRFKVLVEKSGKPGEPFYFPSREMEFFAVLPQQNRTINVTGIRPKAEDLEQLNSIGAKIDGTLSVSVGSGVKVLKHNAESEPTLFGLLGAYKWQIKSPAADPLIVVQPSL